MPLIFLAELEPKFGFGEAFRIYGIPRISIDQIGVDKKIESDKNYLCYVSVLTFQKGPLTRHQLVKYAH